MSGKPSDHDYDAFITRECVRGDLAYQPVPWPELLNAVTEQVKAELGKRRVATFNLRDGHGGLVKKLGDRVVARWKFIMADYAGAPVGPPDAAIVHAWPLVYHQDSVNPYRCINATVTLRGPEPDGGVLVFPDSRVGVQCANGYVTIFDGQRMHGVTDFEGERYGLTYYCPVLVP